MTLEAAVEAACGSAPRAATPLLGGCIAEVYRLDFDDRPPLVAKVARPGGSGGGLAIEGFMLDYLARHSALAVPTTRHTADRLLLMDYVDHHPGRSSAAAKEDAARQPAALHGLTAEAFGFDRDTVIGALPPPNPRTRQCGSTGGHPAGPVWGRTC